MPAPLERLEPGQPIVFAGDRVVTVPPELAAAFRPGDALLVDERAGELLHVPAAARRAAREAVTAAVDAAMLLGAVEDAAVDRFFHGSRTASRTTGRSRRSPRRTRGPRRRP
jgi:glutamate-5-semialdehyde dehydrogenase